MFPALEKLTQVNDSLKRTTYAYMVVVAVLIGVAGGYSAVGFRYLIEAFHWVAWGSTHYSAALVQGFPWYWVVGVPTVGGLVVGVIVSWFAPEAKGHGVPEVMEAVAIRGARIRPRVVAAKAVASSICIASGGSVGSEGPVVQMGAAVGSTIGQLLQVNTRRLRTLVGCGAAAGIAATFNAPVAGALFAVEVILGDFGVPQFSPIVVSSVVATVISRYYLGDSPAFAIAPYRLETPYELIVYVILGLLAAPMAIIFIRTLSFGEEVFDRLPMPAPLKTALGGLVIGLIGLYAPLAIGVGYEGIGGAISGNFSAMLLVALLLAKIVAVSITIGSGGSGGVFAPSLFIGATLGGAVGYAAHAVMPFPVASPGAYALVGMGAVLAGATRAPIMAIVMIFELTADYRIILPLMTSCIIGTLLSQRLFADSIYTEKLTRRGVNVSGGQEINLLRKVPARDVLVTDFPVLRPDEKLDDIIEKMVDGSATNYYVMGPDKKLEGVVSLADLRPVLQEANSLRDIVVARDVANGNVPQIAPGDTLDSVINRLDLGYRDEMPVVEDGKLLGIVRLEDVLARYRKELFKQEMAGSVAGSMARANRGQVVESVGDYVVFELDAPAPFWDRTLPELEVRRRYGVNVLLVRQASAAPDQAPAPPEADYRMRAGDRIVVFGSRAQIEKLRRA